jgi:SAM-dependent methyltransferase
VPQTERNIMTHAYQSDLAHIHDAGFGHLAKNAAAVVIAALRRMGVQSGTVVDLGCGSGIASRALRDAGYEVVGIDLSEPFIAMARKSVPEGVFHVASFATANIPRCVAVTAIGEVFNYTVDTANSPAIRTSVFERIYAALAPGGLLVFDMAGPARAPSSNPQRTFAEGPDWVVLVETASDRANRVLTRCITTFRKLGELYRRDCETHQLELVDPLEVVALLQRIGFSVQTLSSYGSHVLPPGLVGFLARKPGGAGAGALSIDTKEILL